MTAVDDELVRDLIDCFARSVDAKRLKGELEKRLPRAEPPKAAPSEPPPAATASPKSEKVATRVLEKLAMSDLLDASILGARPGSPSFPLRLFFGELSEHADEETGFALGSGLNFYFRVPMDEENKARLGQEVSRLYYLFAEETDMGKELVRQLSPLLARLLNSELERVSFEAVDHVPVFDSNIHERSGKSDPTSSSVSAPLGFLCRVVANRRVRFKAMVRT